MIPIQEVLYFHAEDKYIEVHLEHVEVLIEESLKTLEQEFAERFIRVHRNCLVALDRITGLRRDAEGGMQVELRGSNKLIEVSRRNLPGLRKLVKEL